MPDRVNPGGPCAVGIAVASLGRSNVGWLSAAKPLRAARSRFGLQARVFDHKRMAPLADRIIAALQRRLREESEAALRRGMPFPTGWDPYFDHMTLAEIYRYATRHFEHHRRQLSLGTSS